MNISVQMLDGSVVSCAIPELLLEVISQVMDDGYNTVFKLDGSTNTSVAYRMAHELHTARGILAFAKAVPVVVRNGDNRSRDAAITYPHAYVLFNNSRLVYGNFKYDPATRAYALS